MSGVWAAVVDGVVALDKAAGYDKWQDLGKGQ